MTNSVGALMTSLSQKLSTNSDTPRLDVEVLLSHVTGKNKTFFMTWPEHVLSASQLTALEALIERRLQGEPIAYLTGEREFWSFTLKTSPETLIPRPDTEVIVETALHLADKLPKNCRVLDLGTGTGAIALALASEQKNWTVTGSDIAVSCISLAKQNLQNLRLTNCQFIQSSWYEEFNGRCFDLIVSNPPYIDKNDPHLTQGDVQFEPKRALVAEDAGYADIQHIIANASKYLSAQGWLLLEHGYNQADKVQEIFGLHGFNKIDTIADYGQQPRVTIGCFSGNLSLKL